MRDMVKAAVLTAPRNIEVQQFPYPEMPKNGAIMRMELSGIYESVVRAIYLSVESEPWMNLLRPFGIEKVTC